MDRMQWECSLKARSLFPSAEKRLDSAFALPASSRKPCPLSLHTIFFTAYPIARGATIDTCNINILSLLFLSFRACLSSRKWGNPESSLFSLDSRYPLPATRLGGHKLCRHRLRRHKLRGNDETADIYYAAFNN